jgi:hypothetical protein
LNVENLQQKKKLLQGICNQKEQKEKERQDFASLALCHSQSTMIFQCVHLAL